MLSIMPFFHQSITWLTVTLRFPFLQSNPYSTLYLRMKFVDHQLIVFDCWSLAPYVLIKLPAQVRPSQCGNFMLTQLLRYCGRGKSSSLSASVIEDPEAGPDHCVPVTGVWVVWAWDGNGFACPSCGVWTVIELEQAWPLLARDCELWSPIHGSDLHQSCGLRFLEIGAPLPLPGGAQKVSTKVCERSTLQSAVGSDISHERADKETF